MIEKVITIPLTVLVTATIGFSLFAERGSKANARIFEQPTPCDEEMKDEKSNNCLTCHKGISPIRCMDSKMFRDIVSEGEKTGMGNHCVVCHGGDPTIRLTQEIEVGSETFSDLTKRAHSGAPDIFKTTGGPIEFYPDPGSPWINERTCGLCHEELVSAQWRNLMMTEAGKIQGTAWGFGGLSRYEHKWANYPVKAPPTAKLGGTGAYRKYLAELAQKEPNVFPRGMDAIAEAPRGDKDIAADPRQAAFTYLRAECQRCHLGVGGMQRYGDYRGLGCSACHMPYSNSGLYEGEDASIDNDKGGHVLVHRMQSTHDSPVKVGSVTYSGIPVSTCTTCHNRGRRIGVSFQGLMETAYQSPWQADGSPQQQIHGKNYLKLKPDLHTGKGFVCQDCHTSYDVHSSNHLIGALTATVEIECTDCHGTTSKYPWELPLGTGDEYSPSPQKGEPRGVSSEYPKHLMDGEQRPREGKYLRSARGNAIGNAVRNGDTVRVFLSSGEIRELTPLKGMVQGKRFTIEGEVAMHQIKGHLERMECYACHATWAPQCYGCHLKVDYSSESKNYDWVALGNNHMSNGLTSEYTDSGEANRIPGKITETRSYLRFEDPALAQNGEGRISPVVPGCQTTVTIINKQGNPVIENHIFRVKNAEGKKIPGQLAIDMSPLHPHTVQKQARNCESCHDNPKALGYGIAAGAIYDDPNKNHAVELMSGDGKIIPAQTSPLITAIKGLKTDWSRFVTEDGEQLQTVGHHLQLSRPLNNKERSHMDRRGICLSCHTQIPDRSLAVNLLHHIADKTNMLPKTTSEHAALIEGILLLSGWTQLAFALGLVLFLIAVAIYVKRRKRTRS